jgi:hypothetical protein
MEIDRETNEGRDVFSEEERRMDQSEYLAGLGKWSKIVLGAALVGGALLAYGRVAEASSDASVGGPLLTSDQEALVHLAAWANHRGGSAAWANHAGGGGAWANHGGSAGWVNRYGGGAAWANHGGGGWINSYGGGGAWANHGGSAGWVNRHGGGGAWANHGGGGGWVNRY